MTEWREGRRVDRAYERYAKDPRKQRSWSAQNPGNAALRAELVNTAFAMAGAELRQARRILDVGCGTGWWLDELERRIEIGGILHGVDALPRRIEQARERVPTAKIEPGDARDLPYATQSFDVVTMFTVLSSMSGRADAGRALGEARRVLAPGGALLIWEPRLPNPSNRQTVLISSGLIRQVLLGLSIESRSVTLLPPLARRLGGHADRVYPILVRIPLLRTHRLTCARAPDPGFPRLE